MFAVAMLTAPFIIGLGFWRERTAKTIYHYGRTYRRSAWVRIGWRVSRIARMQLRKGIHRG